MTEETILPCGCKKGECIHKDLSDFEYLFKFGIKKVGKAAAKSVKGHSKLDLTKKTGQQLKKLWKTEKKAKKKV